MQLFYLLTSTTIVRLARNLLVYSLRLIYMTVTLFIIAVLILAILASLLFNPSVDRF